MLSFLSKRPPPEALKPATVLVLQQDNYDWSTILKEAILNDGRRLNVVQCGWSDIHVHADTYSTVGLCVEVRSVKSATKEGQPAGRNQTIHPEFVLVRNEVTTADFHGRGLLSGLLFADVPSVNSLQSILLFCDRAAVMGQLHKLNRRLGDDFPVMPQHFASSHRSFMYGYTFPAVVKVGSAHAGTGKMRINDHHQMSDFRSVLAMMPHEHCFAEPFIRGSCDLRIQKIGKHYRAYRRVSVSGEWKTQTGTSSAEEVRCEARWKVWADEASKMFGGLDILSVDAIVEEGTGKEFIMEVNGTSSGLFPDNAEEDNRHIAELVIERMNSELRAPASSADP
jgi:glutathione synthase/RimK-type ligase-like ATP-grasp enzyme